MRESYNIKQLHYINCDAMKVKIVCNREGNYV